jgi:hypothetical protein
VDSLWSPHQIGGLRVFVTAPWITNIEYRTVHYAPVRLGQTARQRAWNRLTKWRVERFEVEVDNHPVMRMGDSLYMTARTQQRLKSRLEAEALNPNSGGGS